MYPDTVSCLTLPGRIFSPVYHICIPTSCLQTQSSSTLHHLPTTSTPPGLPICMSPSLILPHFYRLHCTINPKPYALLAQVEFLLKVTHLSCTLHHPPFTCIAPALAICMPSSLLRYTFITYTTPSAHHLHSPYTSHLNIDISPPSAYHLTRRSGTGHCPARGYIVAAYKV